MAYSNMDYDAMKRTALLYEEKLKELMTQVEFKTFSVEVAKKVFRAEIEGMKDGDFKDFCIDNFDNITGDKT